MGYSGPTSSLRELAALQRFTDAALAHLTMGDLLAELLDRVTEILQTDTAAFLLLDPDAEELEARAAKGIEEEVEQAVRIPLGAGFAGRVAAQRRPIFVPNVDEFDIYNPILRQKGIRSLLGVPLLVEGRILGVLHVGTLTPREFTDADAELLQVAADRAAFAIDHAALFERERAAREEADRTLSMLRAVQRVTDAALAGLSLEDLLKVLLDRVTEILGTDTAAILLLDDGWQILRARAAKGIEEEVEQGVRVPLGKGFAGRVAAHGRPIFIPDIDHFDIHNPILRQKGIRSMLGVPLRVEARILGVLHVGTLSPREFTEGDTELLQVAADRAALAIDHAQGFEQLRLAAALQAALLPQELSPLPGVELAARYLPAAQGGSLGGDWYDVFPIGGGRLALVVGDVVGRGVAAASLMAQLRTGLRAYALEGHPPEQVMERVNDLLEFIRPSTMTTAAFLVLDPERETLAAVNAGHPPPLLLAPDGTARYLELPRGVPLGVSRGTLYEVTEHRIPAGATVVLYTDGVVEVRGESIDIGLARLCGIAEAGHDSLETLCDDVVGQLVVSAAKADDVALLAARIAPLPEQLATEWRAHADSLAGLRHLLRRWLRGQGATEHEIYDITVACQEAAANAVEHAYAPGRRTFEVGAVRRGATIEVTVRDHGRWRPARGIHRGRGLSLMKALMDSVEIDHGQSGTVIVLKRALAAGAPEP